MHMQFILDAYIYVMYMHRLPATLNCINLYNGNIYSTRIELRYISLVLRSLASIIPRELNFSNKFAPN